MKLCLILSHHHKKADHRPECKANVRGNTGACSELLIYMRLMYWGIYHFRSHCVFTIKGNQKAVVSATSRSRQEIRQQLAASAGTKEGHSKGRTKRKDRGSLDVAGTCFPSMVILPSNVFVYSKWSHLRGVPLVEMHIMSQTTLPSASSVPLPSIKSTPAPSQMMTKMDNRHPNWRSLRLGLWIAAFCYCRFGKGGKIMLETYYIPQAWTSYEFDSWWCMWSCYHICRCMYVIGRLCELAIVVVQKSDSALFPLNSRGLESLICSI